MTKLKKTIEFRTPFGLYIANEIIGEGGAGRVYNANDESGDVWAIKTLDPNKTSKEKLKR